MTTDEDIKEIKEKLKEIRNILVGNGKLGLVAKTEIMWRVGVFVVCGLGFQMFIIIRLVSTN